MKRRQLFRSTWDWPVSDSEALASQVNSYYDVRANNSISKESLRTTKDKQPVANHSSEGKDRSNNRYTLISNSKTIFLVFRKISSETSNMAVIIDKNKNVVTTTKHYSSGRPCKIDIGNNRLINRRSWRSMVNKYFSRDLNHGSQPIRS